MSCTGTGRFGYCPSPGIIGTPLRLLITSVLCYEAPSIKHFASTFSIIQRQSTRSTWPSKPPSASESWPREPPSERANIVGCLRKSKLVMELEEPSSRRGGEKVAQRPQATSESSEETETHECRSGEFQRSGVLEESYPVLATSIVLETDYVLEPASHSLVESSDVPNSGKIERPGPYDILLGREKSYQIHQGNRRLHKIVAAHKPYYMRSKQKEKCEIAKMIMKLVKESDSEPVRFLRREGHFWGEVPSEVAREKVSHALRCKARKRNRCKARKRNRSEDPSSEDAVLTCPPFGPPPLMGAAPLSTSAGVADGNHPLRKPIPYNEVSAPAFPTAAVYMHYVSLPVALPPSWGQPYHATLPRPTRMGGLGISLTAPGSYIPVPRVPYGMQMTMPRGPRGYSETPVGMLSDHQILETLLQRRQARTLVPDRPQFPPFSF